MRESFWLVLFACASYIVCQSSWAEDGALRNQQREQFLSLEKQLNSLPVSKLPAIHADIEELANYPLVPYLKLRLAERTLANLSDDTVEAFLARYAGTPIADRLRKRWLDLLSQRARKAVFIDAYQPGLGTRYTCTYLDYQLQLTDTPDYWFEQVDDLWLSGDSQPKECDPVFAVWKKNGRMTTDMVLQRVEKVIRGGDRNLLGYLQRRLPDSYHYLVALWRATHRNPTTVLRYREFPGRYPRWERPVLYYGLIRLAWQSPEKAIKAFQYWQDKVSFNDVQIREIERAIAINSVLEGESSAEEWLSRANVPAADEDVRHWHLAYWLRQRDWAKVLSVIESAPPEEQQQSALRYWRARSLGELGFHQEQQQLFTALADERHYYGFLASARLQQQPQLADRPLVVSDYTIAKVSTVPAVQRSYEWFKLGRFVEARREWYHLNQRLTNAEQHAATLIASDWGWHDQAIIGFANTGYYSDVKRRFPLAFADEFRQRASQHDVDQAFAMAIARRESSFMVDAVSPAGARGLMQLMPGTVNYISKQKVSYSSLLQPEQNLEFGMQYLKYLNDKLNHNPVLVSASYNAGWRRVLQWLPTEGEQELDIWIENIPYHETRHYVKAVMAYRYIYQVQLGQQSELFDTLSRMKVSADSLTLP
ncbi:transglycosylase SLT domain-containing protein [Alteromonas gilva]|uniref:Transglycosylase SLT domain-containing protein n=1 Tax=Alteromonas gilva TaxID=2987522 RepID=A0ABT5L875_9ALTE|nr:transglycosylase SLT domain-containing protein [Alteromonas gilva]MDC8833113.1 transglycosylase SLT domain-containing protein [Alteromonas gilva]